MEVYAYCTIQSHCNCCNSLQIVRKLQKSVEPSRFVNLTLHYFFTDLENYIWVQSLKEAEIKVERYELLTGTSYSCSHKDLGFRKKGKILSFLFSCFFKKGLSTCLKIGE